MPVKESLKLFAITAPGIEGITARELETMGIAPSEVERGGVSFSGSMSSLYDANLRLRSATRILARAATFHASSFAELERRAKKIPWADFLAPGASVELKITCRKSRLYHSDAVAERLMKSVQAAISGAQF